MANVVAAKELAETVGAKELPASAAPLSITLEDISSDAVVATRYDIE